MKKQYAPRWLALLLAMAAALSGCGLRESSETSSPASENTSAQSEETVSGATEISAIPGGDYTQKDLNTQWTEDGCTVITLSGDSASVSGKGAEAGDGTITITQAGDYLISGTLTGQIIVDADKTDDVRLVLNGASITSPDSAAIWVKQADKVILTLAEESQNQLTDAVSRAEASSEEEDIPNAALYSQDDLSINGSGSLTVTGSYDHGVFTKNDLVIAGGEISVTAQGDGLKGKDSVAVCGGHITISAGGDGIQASENDDYADGWIRIDGGTLSIDAGQDGIQAETVLYLSDGEISLTTGGGSYGEGVKADQQGGGFDAPGGFGGGRDFGGRGGRGTAPTELPDGETAPDLPQDNFSERGERQAPDGQTPSDRPAGGMEQAAAAVEDAESADTTVSTKGLKAGTLLQIEGGQVTADCYDDTIHCNGDIVINGGVLTLSSGDDGIHADDTLTVNEGEITITRSYEGLEAQTLTVNGGDINATATDDGLNAAGGSDGSSLGGRPGQNSFSGGDAFIVINGGTITVNASGDGIDSNGSLEITGGVTLVSGPNDNANSALDCDGNFSLTGGVLLAAGSGGMAQAPREAKQPAIQLNFAQGLSDESTIALTDDDGQILCVFTAAKSFQSLIISLPQLTVGNTYHLLTGGTVSGQPTAGDGSTAFYEGAAYQGGTQVQTFTLAEGVNNLTISG